MVDNEHIYTWRHLDIVLDVGEDEDVGWWRLGWRSSHKLETNPNWAKAQVTNFSQTFFDIVNSYSDIWQPNLEVQNEKWVLKTFNGVHD